MFENWATTCLILVLLALALWGFHRIALWAEDRGWIYYRRRKGSASDLGNAFLQVQSLLEPGKEEIVEARLAESTDRSEPGDPPTPPPTKPTK